MKRIPMLKAKRGNPDTSQRATAARVPGSANTTNAPITSAAAPASPPWSRYDAGNTPAALARGAGAESEPSHAPTIADSCPAALSSPHSTYPDYGGGALTAYSQPSGQGLGAGVPPTGASVMGSTDALMGWKSAQATRTEVPPPAVMLARISSGDAPLAAVNLGLKMLKARRRWTVKPDVIDLVSSSSSSEGNHGSDHSGTANCACKRQRSDDPAGNDDGENGGPGRASGTEIAAG
ncbi:hypothetical protein Vafri_11458 [Volvox africanus]|nr:hypothetical protein Vafri_11458 [Volvox africanus]